MKSKTEKKFWCGFGLIVLVAVITVAESSRAGNTNHVVPFKKNVRQTLEQMKCGKPQKRLVYIEEEYEKYQPQALYFPRAAVVHRCDKAAGCCMKLTEVCLPAETRNVSFVFQEIPIGGKKKSIRVNIIDHLLCECQSNAWDAPR